MIKIKNFPEWYSQEIKCPDIWMLHLPTCRRFHSFHCTRGQELWPFWKWIFCLLLPLQSINITIPGEEVELLKSHALIIPKWFNLGNQIEINVVFFKHCCHVEPTHLIHLWHCKLLCVKAH